MSARPPQPDAATVLRAEDFKGEVHLPPCAPAGASVTPRELACRLAEGLCPGCAGRLGVVGDLGYCPSSPGIGWRLDGNVVTVGVTHTVQRW